jgi:hypothetical protein
MMPRNTTVVFRRIAFVFGVVPSAAFAQRFMDYIGLYLTLVLALLGVSVSHHTHYVRSVRARPRASPVFRKNRWSRGLYLVVHDAV